MGADALELALALHQAPIERFGLRDRPLPENIGEALQLASAMQPQLEAAAARFSESEETMVEAVRFYLHQVLFEPGTDAYRVLGLDPKADIKLIRQHHIWLQRWLHPDRRGEDWEAVLATKVNWAWQQLRNDTSRETYDHVRRSAIQSRAHVAETEAVIQAPAWSAAPVGKARPHWLRRSVISGLLLLCAGLFYLGATRQDRVDPDALAIQSVDSHTSIRPRMPFASDSALKNSNSNAERAESEDPAPLLSEATSALPDSQSEAGERQANATLKARAPVDAASIAAIATGSDWKPAPLSGQTAALATHAVDIAPPHVGTVSPRPNISVAESSERKGLPRQQPLIPASTAKIDRQSVSQIISSEARSAVVVQEPKRVVPTEKILAERATSMAALTPSANVAKVVPRPTQKIEEVAPAQIPQTSIASITSPSVDATSEIEDPTAVAASDAHIELATQSQHERSDQASPEALSRETLARFEVARKRVSGMIDFFRNQDAAATKWGDDQGLLTVERERTAMLARNGQGIERFALDPPTWRITNAVVSLHANYHVDQKNESAESGQLKLSMAWREGGWKITRIEVSPSR